MGCDGFNDPESPYIEKYVVFANLSGNKAMINDTVFVSCLLYTSDAADE